MNSTSGGKVVDFEPLQFKDAESCLQLTLHTLNLNVKDAEFLEKAMRVYAELRLKEYLNRQANFNRQTYAAERKACEARVRSELAKNYPNLTGADLEKQIEKAVVTQLAAEKCSLGKLGIKIVPNADGFSLFNKAGEEVSYRVSVADALKAQKALVAKETREMLDSRYDDLKSGKVQPIDGEEAFARLKAKTDIEAGRFDDRIARAVADDKAGKTQPL